MNTPARQSARQSSSQPAIQPANNNNNKNGDDPTVIIVIAAVIIINNTVRMQQQAQLAAAHFARFLINTNFSQTPPSNQLGFGQNKTQQNRKPKTENRKSKLPTKNDRKVMSSQVESGRREPEPQWIKCAEKFRIIIFHVPRSGSIRSLVGVPVCWWVGGVAFKRA